MKEIEDANVGDCLKLTLPMDYLYEHLNDMGQREVTGRRAVSNLEYRAKKEKPVQKQLDEQGAESFKPVHLEYYKGKDRFSVCDGYTRITVFLRNNITTIGAVVDISK